MACPAWLEAIIYETVPREVLYEWAGRVRCPAVVLRGATSLESVREFVEELAGTMPITTVMAVKGPHALPMEFPGKPGWPCWRPCAYYAAKPTVDRNPG